MPKRIWNLVSRTHYAKFLTFNSQTGFTTISQRERGFTLIEALVAIVIISGIGVITSDLLIRTFQANNKSQIINLIKQNGQSTMGDLERNIRFADEVVCVSGIETGNVTRGNTITVSNKGNYTRIRFIPEAGSANGYIIEDFPPPISDPNNQAEKKDLCSANLDSTKTQYLTTQDGKISVRSGSFMLDKNGYKPTVNIDFTVTAAINTPSRADQQVGEGVNFNTTITLR